MVSGEGVEEMLPVCRIGLSRYGPDLLASKGHEKACPSFLDQYVAHVVPEFELEQPPTSDGSEALDATAERCTHMVSVRIKGRTNAEIAVSRV